MASTAVSASRWEDWDGFIGLGEGVWVLKGNKKCNSGGKKH